MSEHQPLPSPEQVMQRILDDVLHDEDGYIYESSALDPIKEMQREILDLREAVRVLAEECHAHREWDQGIKGSMDQGIEGSSEEKAI